MLKYLFYGRCPKEFKLARVVLISKAGDSTLITNFRPISILAWFAKIFERVISNHLMILRIAIKLFINIILDLDKGTPHCRR